MCGAVSFAALCLFFNLTLVIIKISGRPQKKVTVLEAPHNHVFNDRLFKFPGVVSDITQSCHMNLFLMSDVGSLSCILSNENALIQKSAQIVDKSKHLFAFVTTCMDDIVVFYSRIQTPH